MDEMNTTMDGSHIDQSNLQDFFVINGKTLTYKHDAKNKMKVTSISIPDGTIQVIEKDVFVFFRNLQSITLPKDLKKIGRSAFDRCKSLTSITWNALQFDTDECKEGPFFGIAPKITSFAFGDEVETVPRCLLSGMTNILSINIPDSVKTIEEGAFKNCKRLEELVLSANIREIEGQAFAGCQSIYKIVCLATKVPCIEKDTFEGLSPRVELYVPQESVKKYCIHPYWGNFCVLPLPDSNM